MTNSDNLSEKLINSTTVFIGNFLRVIRDSVELPNDLKTTREYIEHSGAAAVFAIDEAGNLILERQYRHPVREIVVEIPAGKIDAQESALECAERELREETGYIAQNWVKIGEVYPCVSYATERIVFYVATELTLVGAKLDEGEFLEVYKQPIGEFLSQAQLGKIKDGKTLAGVTLLQGYLSTNSQAKND